MAMLAFAYRPAFAHTHSEHMHHGDENISVAQEIPSGGHAAGQEAVSCPNHANQQCTCVSQLVLMHCETGGCCYKDGSSIPANTDDSASGGQESAIAVSAGYPVTTIFLGIVPLGQSKEVRTPVSPIPRPPLA